MDISGWFWALSYDPLVAGMAAALVNTTAVVIMWYIGRRDSRRNMVNMMAALERHDKDVLAPLWYHLVDVEREDRSG